MRERDVLRILLACETSNVTSKEFRKLGHKVTSCDMLPNDEDQTNHYTGDVTDILNDGWDLMIAHPPCFRLSKASGAHWKKEWFKKEQEQALEFVKLLMKAPIKHICIENPIGKINTAIRKPDQIIHPYFFGDAWMKETCLWLKNLPKLTYCVQDNLFETTTAVEPKGNWVKPGNKRPHRRFDDVKEGGKGNWKDRSKSFEGIAKAMAEQWGSRLKTSH